MNPAELATRIKKFKARRLKARLSYYGTFVSLFLTLSPFGSGFSLTTLVAFLLILPLPLYFMLQSLKLYRKAHQLPSTNYQLPQRFSLYQFLSQPSFTFRLSLVLFFLVILTTLARVHTPDTDPALTYHLESGI